MVYQEVAKGSKRYPASDIIFIHTMWYVFDQSAHSIFIGVLIFCIDVILVFLYWERECQLTMARAVKISILRHIRVEYDIPFLLLNQAILQLSGTRVK